MKVFNSFSKIGHPARLSPWQFGGLRAGASLLKLALMAGLGIGAVGQSYGATLITWGSQALSSLKDSNGATLDGSFTFSLGTFWTNDTGAGGSAFDPAVEDPREWGANWRVFDTASYTADQDLDDPGDQGGFAGSAFIDTDGRSKVENPTYDSGQPEGPGNLRLISNPDPEVSADFDFSGKLAYIWVYNQTTYEDYVIEWFLGRDESWVFPAIDEIPDTCCNNSLPNEWSLGTMASGGDVPEWGGQSGNIGSGFTPAPPGSFDMQTFSAIPELTAVPAMLAVALAVGLHRERRRVVKA